MLATVFLAAFCSALSSSTLLDESDLAFLIESCSDLKASTLLALSVERIPLEEELDVEPFIAI
ncbi:hypothetical protein D3C85_1053870 [compost metagenome]